MEQVSFDYSTKCIPTAQPNDYLTCFIDKSEQLVRRMRWRAYFFLNPDLDRPASETYGFKSSKRPPEIEALKDFETRLFALIPKIKFKNWNNALQSKLSKDVQDIQRSSKVIVPADKTANYYKLEKTEYERLLHNQVTNSYKKAPDSTRREIIKKDQRIAQSLDISDRIDIPASREAFITLKDHKPNFVNNLPCRLINPYKSEIGYISKQILDRINSKVISCTNLNQWKNTAAVVTWFEAIPDKPRNSFITFDVVDFYPSITQELLVEALTFASNHDQQISDREIDIILHAKKSLLFNDGTQWSKKNTQDLFDVTMGSYDGAETCELVGAYLLSKLAPVCQCSIGIYRDDGLATSTKTPRQIELLKKNICKIFRDHNLKITIEANQKVVNFLDVTFDLNSGTFKPFLKQNSNISYVSPQSNHPPSILKNIPKGINHRLSSISSNEAVFKQSTSPYQRALDSSGYKHKLSYSRVTQTNQRQQNRSRKIIWFNPPFSANVATNIGQQFLQLIDRCFPTGHVLRKIFNRNTLKLSYSCMPSIGRIIKSHNKKILSGPQNDSNQTRNCSCRNREECPLQGQCLTRSIVYQATVTRADNNRTESYVGITANDFKQRFNNHTSNFTNRDQWKTTALSKYIWSLRDQNIQYSVKWRILKRRRAYTSATKKCYLCMYEKFIILCKPHLATLNKRNEILATCRHRAKFKLSNF